MCLFMWATHPGSEMCSEATAMLIHQYTKARPLLNAHYKESIDLVAPLLSADTARSRAVAACWMFNVSGGVKKETAVGFNDWWSWRFDVSRVPQQQETRCRGLHQCCPTLTNTYRCAHRHTHTHTHSNTLTHTTNTVFLPLLVNVSVCPP